jgi:hypothetical protein
VLHDVRRSFVTLLAERGHSEAVLDQLISHRQSATRSGVLGVYQRAKLWPQQCAAVREWDRILEKAVRGEVSAGTGTDPGLQTVVPFKRAEAC